MTLSVVECPSGFAFRPRKFSGRIMAQMAAKADVDDLSSIVASCCVEVVDPGPYALGEKDGLPNWKRVITGDLAVAFVRIRQLSIPASYDGDLFQWKIRCPNAECLDEVKDAKTGAVRMVRHELFWRVMLSELPVVPLSAEARDLVKRGNRSFLGKLLDDRRFTFKLPTDEDGSVIRKLVREHGIALQDVQAGRLNEALRPFAMAACVTSIEGVEAHALANEVLDLDPWSQADIQAQIGKSDGGFDTFKGRCDRDACATEFDLALPFSPQLLMSLSSTELRAKPKPSSEEPRGSSTTASPG
jgi:hypothetical protein